ncbi:acyl-CoA dehydrogenase [Desulfosarcina ovata]|uniref:Acyl-CoA dehydrogenase n=1 Tax=Desulfosarcina ovata subsp. ovata TaxID=2752305 RepID=A0A5K8A8D2_9BACT|nr:acyl-CoA dehydrogenase [Desulfosarcina ovata]BBO88688.1 acyl-CoA dehydrogenase [Desulfosarcina ovata subsp. ovata]
MAQLVVERRDVDFVLHEQLEVEKLSKHEKFADFNRKTVDLIISEARSLAIKEMLPALKLGDEEGCRFENGTVTVPEAFQRLYDLLKEGEWIAMCDDPQWGGQGMPTTVSLAAMNYFDGANYPFMLHTILLHGAAKLVETFGTEKQKALYLKKMLSGEWGGTMLLTEPEAGSDVGALTTAAVKNDDGTYTISGSKIFISAGENDLVENIVHPVLARIEGAPAGTDGISLFLVPKICVNDDGSLGDRNDVVCTGIEEKMGIHASPTCSLTLGGKGNCRGTLLGKENKGMRAMFVMMNEARLEVGMQGLGCASASYLNALAYARERIQGRSLQATSKEAPPVPIIQHPDVRRMLLSMKAYTEGMRSIIYYIGWCEDQIRTSSDADEKQKYQGLIDVLTPIGKGYVTDKSFEVCNQGVQIFGGYGYTKEYPQEQLLRDCKITHLYEGTNGIQAMDLLGRKLGLNKGQSYKDLIKEMRDMAETAKTVGGLETLAADVEKAINKLEETALSIGSTARSENMMSAFAHAYSFMEVTGDTVMAWMLLWRAVLATRKLSDGAKKKDLNFYDGQVKSARYFIKSVLPLTLAKADIIIAGDDTVMQISEDAFGSK